MLIGQLAGAAVGLQRHTATGATSVDQWQLSFSFLRSVHGSLMQIAPHAQLVDVSSDIAGRDCNQYKDDNKVYCIQVAHNNNFLTHRLTTTPHTHHTPAHPTFIGNCMALNTQMDVQEFANILFDQIEKELKHTQLTSIAAIESCVRW